MRRNRDTQRKKVYVWTAHTLRPMAGLTGNQADDPQMTRREVASLVNQVCSDYGLEPIQVKVSGRMTRSAGHVAYYSRQEARRRDIRGATLRGNIIPRLELSANGGLNRLTILHELAHYIIASYWGFRQVADHGPEFMGCLLDLLVDWTELDRAELVKSLYFVEVPYYKKVRNPNTGITYLKKAIRTVTIRAAPAWRNPQGLAGLAGLSNHRRGQGRLMDTARSAAPSARAIRVAPGRRVVSPTAWTGNRPTRGGGRPVSLGQLDKREKGENMADAKPSDGDRADEARDAMLGDDGCWAGRVGHPDPQSPGDPASRRARLAGFARRVRRRGDPEFPKQPEAEQDAAGDRPCMGGLRRPSAGEGLRARLRRRKSTIETAPQDCADLIVKPPMRHSARAGSPAPTTRKPGRPERAPLRPAGACATKRTAITGPAPMPPSGCRDTKSREGITSVPDPERRETGPPIRHRV